MTATAPAASVDEMVEYYHRFLARNGYDGHLKRFCDRLEADPHSAQAEAIVFQILWSQGVHPDIFEDNSTGGPDFCCKPSPQESFLVEVKSLDSTSVSNKSGLPLEVTSGGSAYSLITRKLRLAAKGKTKQLGKHGLPGILAITSAYGYAGLVMNRMAAQNLLVSDPCIRVPIGKGREHSYWSTDLEDAVFCQRSITVNASNEHTITPRSESISAILLITIYRREVNVVGLLHPAPFYRFDPQWLPGVPYVRFKQWPFTKGKVETEWILGEGEMQHGEAVFPHRHIV